MTISLHYNYTLDSTNQTYLGERDFLLKVAENNPLRLYGQGLPGGSPAGLTVTLDSAYRPVIGYGYDLIANVITAYSDLHAVGATINTDAAGLQNAINGYQAGTTTLAQLNALISLPSEATATALLDTTANDRQTKLNSFLAGYGITWISSAGGSQEYAVLLSMWYQSPGGNGKNGYFMNRVGQISHMTQALIDSNRTEVWYQMRYLSSQGQNGIVVRRYAESTVFGLYNDPNNVSANEAVQAYQMLTNHRNTILAYEKQYGTDPNGASPETPAQQIAAANNNYSLTGNNVVQTLTQTFDTAETVLINSLQSQYSGDTEILSSLLAAKFLSTNIYLAGDTAPQSVAAANNAASLLMAGAGNDTLIGGVGNTILIGGSSADTLKSGSGNDTLIGGAGNDSMIGGSGTDTFVYIKPTGVQVAVDTIDDSLGNGAGSVYVGSTQLTGGTAVAGKDNTWTDGNGDQYVFDSSTGALTISQGLLGAVGNDAEWGMAA